MEKLKPLKIQKKIEQDESELATIAYFYARNECRGVIKQMQVCGNCAFFKYSDEQGYWYCENSKPEADNNPKYKCIGWKMDGTL